MLLQVCDGDVSALATPGLHTLLKICRGVVSPRTAADHRVVACREC